MEKCKINLGTTPPRTFVTQLLHLFTRISLSRPALTRHSLIALMGNCCGSQSTADYDEPTAAHTRPQKARVRASGPGHTLGGPADASAGADPRTAAALAAEVCSSFP